MAVSKWQHLGQSGHHASFQNDHQRNVLLAEFRRALTSFRAIAKNSSGTATSTVPTVTYVPVANWNQGVWTVNFCVPSAVNTGTNTPYVGLGVLGTNTYWNALSGSQMENTPISLRDDGVTPSGVKVSTTNSSLGTFSSGVPCNNVLLDQYCQNCDTNNGLNFFFTQVPKGIYNVALYGCTASYADRGIGFTVITNGVSAGTQWVTNAQGTCLRAVRQHSSLYQPADHERDVAGERGNCSGRPHACQQHRGRLQRDATGVGEGRAGYLEHNQQRHEPGPDMGGWRVDAIHQPFDGDRLDDEHGGVAVHVCPDGSAEILQG